MANRFVPATNPLTNESFVHHCDAQRAFAVSFGEAAASQELHADRLEIARRDIVEQREMFILRVVCVV